MAAHDPLFKSLLRSFFAGFLRLVAPELARRLDLPAATFLDKELTASDPPARGLIVDLLARVPFLPGDGRCLLVHTEIEARARRSMGRRLRSYHRWIQTRHDGPVLSIVLFLKGGPAGVREETVDGDLSGPGLTVFRYLSFGLSGCRAAEYLDHAEPLAWALAALMKREGWSRAELRERCLARIREADLSEEEHRELVNCVQTYLEWMPGEAGTSPSPDIRTRRTEEMGESLLFRMSWLDKVALEAEKRGRRDALLEQIEVRFGPVPEEIRRRVHEIQSIERLQRIGRKLVTAKSIASLRLVRNARTSN
jgi:hypothetical protein